MGPSSLPVVRLKPKADARRLRRGHPWVFADELVTDRRTRALLPGTLARLEDPGRRPIGVAAVNPLSRIVGRLLDSDPEAEIGPAWFATRLRRAAEHRARLYTAPFYRLVHAEADGLPGVVIDRFGAIAVVQPNAAWADRLLGPIIDTLAEVTGIETVVMNGTGRARGLEGLPETREVLRGTLPEGPVVVPMNGATYMADLAGGQKTGLFFDQRENQAVAARLALGARVLDVFTHVGGFALATLAAGASHALAVDASAPALALATESAAVTGVVRKFETRQGDAFDVMAALATEGRRFDLVICDPPAFAPSKPALEAGLRAYEKAARQAAALVEEGGYLVLCSCSHAATPEKFRAACLRGIGRAGRRVQLIHTGAAGPDHPVLPQLAESGYLKALFFRL